MNLFEQLIRPLLFRMDPEDAHERTLNALEFADKTPGFRFALNFFYGYHHPALEVQVAGLKFPNPVGLAAGFDKDCRLSGILPSLGFGFMELGTVTPEPQPGNPKPRIFRIPPSEAVINSLGFPSCGAHEASRHLLKAPKEHRVPVGINIGMNATTSLDKAAQDYVNAFSVLKPFGDYFVVNVSSPNTRGLRELQERLKLEKILTALRENNKEGKAIFVKLSPDLDAEQLVGLIPLITQMADGAVVSNTTVSRDNVPVEFADRRGGLSGAPIRHRVTDLISQIYRMSEGALPIIGVGGISSPQDAYQKIRAGASLVQLYTGLVYHGPGLVQKINKGLVEILRGHQLNSISEAVGLSNKEKADRHPGGGRGPGKTVSMRNR